MFIITILSQASIRGTFTAQAALPVQVYLAQGAATRIYSLKDLRFLFFYSLINFSTFHLAIYGIKFTLDSFNRIKGTNSHDRHFGAKALIKQLQTDGALGLISTHGLELGELEKECNGRIKNYHFREYYQNNEIRFDYTLKEGISTTRNALYLIKMAGINLEEDI